VTSHLLKTRLLDIHECEELAARETRRAWARLGTEARHKIRRGVASTHRDILFYAAMLAVGLGGAVSLKGSWIGALLLVGVILWLVNRLRRLCVSARRARLAGVSPYRPKAASESQVMGHT
jgi:hypothetical protein